MDPIANLKEQIELALQIQSRTDGESYPDYCYDAANDAERLAELVIALDEWIRKGGFSPWTVSVSNS